MLIVTMQEWLPTIHDRSGTRADAIADAIGADLAAGRLHAGDRLPPQRRLARSLGLSLNTVMRGYAEAARRGYITGQVGRGSYVLQAEPTGAAPNGDPLHRPTDGPIDLSTSLPFLGEAGHALTATLTELSRQPDLAGLLDQGDRAARDRQLRAGAAWLTGLGVAADPNCMLITNGAQHGIFVTLLALLRPGDTLLTGPLAYAPIKTIAHHLHVRIRAVAADEEGLLPDALATACRETPVRVLYCTPTLHTPTTATMTEDRRRRIAQVAAAHDLVIVEDDVFGFLPPARPRPLAAIAADRTVLITSTSKSLAPGLRIGYVLAPPSMLADIAAAVSLTSWMAPPLMAEIARRWIEDGTARALTRA
jgi:DNA-binding transcriptional MocR family regulator